MSISPRFICAIAAGLLCSGPAIALGSDADLELALFACQTQFAGNTLYCDAIVGGKCHFTYSLPACYKIERLWNAPDGPAVRLQAMSAEESSKQREADRLLIERLAQ